jgi:hypothetical protein
MHGKCDLRLARLVVPADPSAKNQRCEDYEFSREWSRSTACSWALLHCWHAGGFQACRWRSSPRDSVGIIEGREKQRGLKRRDHKVCNEGVSLAPPACSAFSLQFFGRASPPHRDRLKADSRVRWFDLKVLLLNPFQCRKQASDFGFKLRHQGCSVRQAIVGGKPFEVRRYLDDVLGAEQRG